MSRFLYISLFFFLSLAASGQPQLYVSAPGGLGVCKKPSVTAKLNGKILYGEKVDVVGADSALLVSEGFRTKFIKVAAGKNSGYVVDCYTLPFPPPKAGTKTFEDYLQQLSHIVGTDREASSKKISPYTSDLVKLSFDNGAELWQQVGVSSKLVQIVLPNCSVQQAFQITRLIGEFHRVVTSSTYFPLITDTASSKTPNRKVTVLREEPADDINSPIWKIHFESTSGVYEMLEIFDLDGNAVISYEAGSWAFNG